MEGTGTGGGTAETRDVNLHCTRPASDKHMGHPSPSPPLLLFPKPSAHTARAVTTRGARPSGKHPDVPDELIVFSAPEKRECDDQVITGWLSVAQGEVVARKDHYILDT